MPADLTPLADELAPYAPTSDLPPRLETDCARCQARWPRPGVCDWCACRLPPQPPSPDEAAQLGRVIPRAFRGVTWRDLPRLKQDDGKTPRVACAPEAFMPNRVALSDARRCVLLGPAGAGKTTVASAWAWHHIGLGVDRVRWFDAPELLRNERPEESRATPIELAVTAGALVLDDLGAELEGAPKDSGLLAQRIGACSRVIGERFDRQRPTLITTGFDQAWIERHYGDRIARRVFERAAVVRLGAA